MSDHVLPSPASAGSSTQRSLRIGASKNARATSLNFHLVLPVVFSAHRGRLTDQEPQRSLKFFRHQLARVVRRVRVSFVDVDSPGLHDLPSRASSGEIGCQTSFSFTYYISFNLACRTALGSNAFPMTSSQASTSQVSRPPWCVQSAQVSSSRGTPCCAAPS